MRPSLDPSSSGPALDLSEPVYIIEVGSASGRFAHMFVRSMISLVSQLPYFKKLKWCFVMTDLPKKNIDSWLKHPALAPLFVSGVLDCARYDASDPTQPIHLMMSGATLSKGSCVNPVVAFANYLFCVIEMDAFRVFRDGRMREVLVTTTAAPKEGESTTGVMVPDLSTWSSSFHDSSAPVPQVLTTTKDREGRLRNAKYLARTINERLRYGPARCTRYGSPFPEEWNRVVDYYREAFRTSGHVGDVPDTREGTTDAAAAQVADTVDARHSVDADADPKGVPLLLPTGSARLMAGIRALSRTGSMMFIASDKGYVHEFELLDAEAFSMSQEGSFSLMVNLHALELLARAWGGFGLKLTQTVIEQGDTCLATAAYIVDGQLAGSTASPDEKVSVAVEASVPKVRFDADGKVVSRGASAGTAVASVGTQTDAEALVATRASAAGGAGGDGTGVRAVGANPATTPTAFIASETHRTLVKELKRFMMEEGNAWAYTIDGRYVSPHADAHAYALQGADAVDTAEKEAPAAPKRSPSAAKSSSTSESMARGLDRMTGIVGSRARAVEAAAAAAARPSPDSAAEALQAVRDMFPHASMAFRESLDRFSPTDFYQISSCYEPIVDAPDADPGEGGSRVVPLEGDAEEAAAVEAPAKPTRPTLQQVLAVCRLSNWDQGVLVNAVPHLLRQVEDACSAERIAVAWGMAEAIEQMLHIGEDDDLCFEFGRIFYQMQMPGHVCARLMYEASLELCGPHPITYYNIALCHKENSNYSDALDFFQRCLALDADYAAAAEGIHECRAQLVEETASASSSQVAAERAREARAAVTGPRMSERASSMVERAERLGAQVAGLRAEADAQVLPTQSGAGEPR